MHLFRPKWARHATAADGSLVYERGRDGKPVYETSSVWWVQYRDGRGGRRVRSSLGVTDKAAARELALRLVLKADRSRKGLDDPSDEHRARPILDHVAAWESTLAGRGVTEKHRRDRRACLEAFVTATSARTLRDFDEGRAAGWIDEVSRERTRLGAVRSARDVNRRIRALRQFARWCVATRRVPFDPLPTLKPRSEQADRRHVRRALAPAEAWRLLRAAAARPIAHEDGRRTRKLLTPKQRAALAALGLERAVLYATALYTALRRGELAALRWADLDLERGTLRVRASTAKARRERWGELRPDLVATLSVLASMRGRPRPTDAVFQDAAFPTARGFGRDLLAAGLAHLEAAVGDGKAAAAKPATGGTVARRRRIVAEDDRGRTLDFHSLRVSALTWAQSHAKASPREAQAIAGHARPELTLATYTDPSLLDVRGVYERLPSLGLEALLPSAESAAPAAATGTTGAPPLARALAHTSPESAAVGRSRPVDDDAHAKRGSRRARRKPAKDAVPVEGSSGAGTWT